MRKNQLDYVEQPYVLIGQVGTAFYFIYFLVLIPLVGILEGQLMRTK